MHMSFTLLACNLKGLQTTLTLTYNTDLDLRTALGISISSISSYSNLCMSFLTRVFIMSISHLGRRNTKSLSLSLSCNQIIVPLSCRYVQISVIMFFIPWFAISCKKGKIIVISCPHFTQIFICSRQLQCSISTI